MNFMKYRQNQGDQIWILWRTKQKQGGKILILWNPSKTGRKVSQPKVTAKQWFNVVTNKIKYKI
jgi:hypothetical protein